MENPPAKTERARRWRWAVAAVGLVAAAVIWKGSDRTPTDATEPLVWRGTPPSAAPETTLRVGSFNIHSGRGPDDGPADLARTADQLAKEDLDLAGLYEVNGGFVADQARLLGDRLGMASLFEGTEDRYWHEHFGNALLTKIPVESVIRLDLPCTQPKRFRLALLATVELGGKPVHIIATHLDTRVDHDRQFRYVADLFLALQPPAILMGDLNCAADDRLLAGLLAAPGVQDAIAADRGTSSQAGRIDHILARGLEVTAAGIVKGNASDHPLVWAEFALPAGPIESARNRDRRRAEPRR